MIGEAGDNICVGVKLVEDVCAERTERGRLWIVTVAGLCASVDRRY